MSIAVYSLCSSLHKEAVADVATEPFICEIENALGEDFIFPTDFSEYGTHDLDLLYVRTGGTEGMFKSLNLEGEILLLTSGESNSLAASMEILAYLRITGRDGEIIHGTTDYIAERIKNIKEDTYTTSPFLHKLEPMDLGGMKLGVIGEPSDWLISSKVDYDKARRVLNVELVDIPLQEVIDIVKSKDVDLKSFAGSEAIYDALKDVIAKYALQGFTIRCFDLLTAAQNTGCLAVARLNAEGIPASCEGDIPALLTMAYLQKKRGNPGFQCNLSSIKDDDCLFAHCTVPLNMVKSYTYTTHFESGIGTAIKGELPLGEAEIIKFSPDLERYVSIPATIVRNESKPNLCRTQIVVDAPRAADYFLHEPLSNHHIVSLL